MSEKNENNNVHKKNMRNIIDYNGRINRRGDLSEDSSKNAPLNERSTFSSETDDYGSKNGYGTRRVDRTYYKNKRNNYADAGRNYSRSKEGMRRRYVSEEDRRHKIELEKKRERIRRQRLKAAMILLLAAALSVVLFFMTPLFNIKEIKLNGNNIVTKEMIEDKIGYMIGSNLFSTRKGVIKKKMFEIAQVSDVTVDKDMFPPTITLTITESSPAAYFLSGNTIVVINSELKVIDDSNEFDTEHIPSLSGVSIQSYKLNKNIKTESDEKDEILSMMLSSFEKTGLLPEITYISLDDISNVKFNYANRLEVLCGSQLELERKIRMFKEAINSESVSNNAIGTVDLSVPGQAVYTP